MLNHRTLYDDTVVMCLVYNCSSEHDNVDIIIHIKPYCEINMIHSIYMKIQ